MPIPLPPSLRGRLIAFLALLFLALFGLVLAVGAMVRDHGRHMASDRAMDFARTLATGFEQDVQETRRLLEMLAAARPEDLHGPGCQAYLARLRHNYSHLRNLAVIAADGALRCAAVMPGRPLNLGDRPGVRRARETREFAVASFHQAALDGQPAVAAVLPVLDAMGGISHYLSALIDVNWLNGRMAEKLPEGIVVRLMDPDGTILVRQPNPECCVGRSGLDLPGVRQAFAAGTPQVIEEATWMDGVNRLQADLPLKAPFAGLLSVGIPLDLVQAPAHSVLARGIAVVVALLLASSALAWIGAERLILRPLRALGLAARRLHAGDLEARVPPGGGAELTALAADFNAMAGALAQRQTRLQVAAGVFEHVQEGILVTDAEAKIVAANPRFTEITGYTLAEVVGANPRLFQSGRHPREFYRELWTRLQNTGSWSGEIWNRRKDGTVYPQWLSVSGIRDAAGRLTHYIGVFSDLTARHAAEQAVKQSEHKYRTIVDNAPEGVWMIGPDRRTIEVNQRLCDMLGYEAREMLGRTPMEFADAENRRIFLDHTNRIEASEQRAYEIALRHKDGHNIPTHFSATTLRREDGTVMAALALVTDLTERKRQEEALRRFSQELERRVEQRTHALEVANRELESFSYSISHDLRSPLRAINGFCHLLEEECGAQITGRGPEYLKRVRAASERMGLLIDDLLDLSRVSRQEMQPGEVDLSALAVDALDELRAAEPGRQVECIVAPGVRATGDATLLKAVLQNLLGNAWKYSSKRSPARIEFGVEAHSGRIAYFVRDNGAGFDMAYADRLFGAFQRLHSAEEFPGTGIGLATVARIVHRHGGDVWAEGALGAGATFYFTL